MEINDTRSKLKNIIDGVIIEGASDNCTTTRNILCTSFSTGTTVKRDFASKAITKKEQAKFLKKYPLENSLLKNKLLILNDIMKLKPLLHLSPSCIQRTRIVIAD